MADARIVLFCVLIQEPLRGECKVTGHWPMRELRTGEMKVRYIKPVDPHAVIFSPGGSGGGAWC